MQQCLHNKHNNYKIPRSTTKIIFTNDEELMVKLTNSGIRL